MLINTMTCSIDFRRRVLDKKEQENLTYEQTASRFGVSVSSILRWCRRLEPTTTRNKPATKINIDALKQDVEICPDDYQYERALRLGVSKSGIGDALKRLGISCKKKRFRIQRQMMMNEETFKKK